MTTYLTTLLALLSLSYKCTVFSDNRTTNGEGWIDTGEEALLLLGPDWLGRHRSGKNAHPSIQKTGTCASKMVTHR
jgi:hypothetical protein